MFSDVHHLAFVVSNIDPWESQFLDAFDMTLADRSEMTGEFELELAIFEVGGMYVELIAPTTDSGWVARHLEDHGEGFFHIAFEVSDIRSAMETLRTRGVEFSHEDPKEGYDWLVANLDPAATLVQMQLVEDPGGKR